MQKTNEKCTIRQAVGILLFAASAALLITYFAHLRSYTNSDFLLVVGTVVLSGTAALLIPEEISKNVLYKLWLVLFIEFFIRATVYGRQDFFEYTLLEADSRRIAFFMENKVNLTLFKSIKQLLALPFADMFTNIFGNIGLLVPVPLLFSLSFPKIKSRFLIPFLAGAGLSIFVECTQLFFMCGAFDVDDLLLNSLGAFFGALMAYALSRMSEGSRQ